MPSQHFYTLADQLGAFDVDFDLNSHGKEKNNEDVNAKNDNDVGNDNNNQNFDTDGAGDKDKLFPALDSPISQTSSVRSTTRWTIGWVTPSAILSLFLIAVCLATAHLGFFRWLDQRRVDHTISQPYVAAISLALVNGFRMVLAAALGISFVQIVWNVIRMRPMRLGDLDRLLSVLGNPLQLGRVGLFVRMPIPFLCALLCWCLPIAMVFPNGAITVESEAVTSLAMRHVPTLDPNFIGNGTYNSMLSNALWEADNFGNYAGPSNKVSRVARQAILAGTYVTSSSPCGQNCSYSVEITAPSFQCNDTVSPNLFDWVNSTYPQYDSFVYNYAAIQNVDVLSSAPYELVFQLSWVQGGGYQNLSCTAYEAVYALEVNYLNGTQTVTATTVQQGQRLNSSNFYEDYGMYPQDGGSNGEINSTSTGSGGGNVMDTNKRANIAAVQDALVYALEGYIDELILHAQQTANTIVALSDLSSGTITSPAFNITQDSMQETLQNIVISILTLNQTTTQTTVSETTTINVYSFSDPARLIIPYFLSIFLSLGFIILGGHALLSNGISASTGGLFQTLCTTRGSEQLHDLASQGCLGGRENVPEDLKSLSVMFGVFKDNSGERPIAGLGTEDEIIPLKKGAF